MSDSKTIVDLARDGRVLACSDDGFAPASNLVAEREPEFRFGVFIEGKGQEFDSWETRRHNPAPPDWAIVELGRPGPIATVDIDTHWHDGNHAEAGALYAMVVDDGVPPARDDARWVELLAVSPLDGHAHNVFRVGEVGSGSSWTHVMLESHPDGGIARLRCYADRAPQAVDPGDAPVRRVRHPQPIPRAKDGAHVAPDDAAVAAAWAAVEPGRVVDLAGEQLGGRVVATSNNRYGHSQRLIAASDPVDMGDGWETSRSRAAGHHDHVDVRLGRRGEISGVEVDFTWFPLNNPVEIRVLGADVDGESPTEADWRVLVERTRVKHLAGDKIVFESDALAWRGPLTHVRLESHPDGGANRLRVFGQPVE